MLCFSVGDMFMRVNPCRCPDEGFPFPYVKTLTRFEIGFQKWGVGFFGKDNVVVGYVSVAPGIVLKPKHEYLKAI